MDCGVVINTLTRLKQSVSFTRDFDGPGKQLQDMSFKNTDKLTSVIFVDISFRFFVNIKHLLTF